MANDTTQILKEIRDVLKALTEVVRVAADPPTYVSVDPTPVMWEPSLDAVELGEKYGFKAACEMLGIDPEKAFDPDLGEITSPTEEPHGSD